MYIPEHEYEESINRVIDEVINNLRRLQNERLNLDQIQQRFEQDIELLLAETENVNWSKEGF